MQSHVQPDYFHKCITTWTTNSICSTTHCFCYYFSFKQYNDPQRSSWWSDSKDLNLLKLPGGVQNRGGYFFKELVVINSWRLEGVILLTGLLNTLIYCWVAQPAFMDIAILCYKCNNCLSRHKLSQIAQFINIISESRSHYQHRLGDWINVNCDRGNQPAFFFFFFYNSLQTVMFSLLCTWTHRCQWCWQDG